MITMHRGCVGETDVVNTETDESDTETDESCAEDLLVSFVGTSSTKFIGLSLIEIGAMEFMMVQSPE